MPWLRRIFKRVHRLGALANDALDVFTDGQAVRDSDAQYTDWRNTLNVWHCGGLTNLKFAMAISETISTHLALFSRRLLAKAHLETLSSSLPLDWAKIHITGPRYTSLGWDTDHWAEIHITGPRYRSLDQDTHHWAEIQITGPRYTSQGQDTDHWAQIHIIETRYTSLGPDTHHWAKIQIIGSVAFWMLVKHLKKLCIMAYMYLRNCLYLYHLYVYCINGTISHNALSDGKILWVNHFWQNVVFDRGGGEFYLHIYLLCMLMS